MRTMRLALATVAATSVLVGFAPTAQAGTCQISDPELNEAVCETVYLPAMRIVCSVVDKVVGQCFA